MGDNVAQDLAELIDEFCKQSASHVIEVAKAKYKELHSGGCRMYSQGENCKCFLCQMDNYRHDFVIDDTAVSRLWMEFVFIRCHSADFQRRYVSVDSVERCADCPLTQQPKTSSTCNTNY